MVRWLYRSLAFAQQHKGDASFSIFNYKPRLNFENHIKELELFNRIKDFLNISNNLSITKPRLDRSNSNATVSL